jgi:AraC-like DNA-binding protein
VRPEFQSPAGYVSVNPQNDGRAGKRSVGRNSKTPHAIELAKHYLHDNFNEQVSLDELAAVTKLSRFHLVRAFARRTGIPPHAYQLKLRIERACVLLRAGITAAEAATQVGFADQSHFTRHFKRIRGITPGQYARMHAAGRGSVRLT